MKIIFIIIAIVCIFCPISQAYDDGDFQIWNTDVEEFKINDSLKGTFEEEFRWGDNAREFFYQHYDVGLVYLLNKTISFGGGYRQVYELKKGKFKEENEPYLVGTFFADIKGFAFDSRNRFEYRNFDYQKDSWRYRNKFTLKFPWKFTKLDISPFVSDELLIGISNRITELNQNRAYAGLGLNIINNIKAELYYLFLNTKSSGNWVKSNVFGTKVKVSF